MIRLMRMNGEEEDERNVGEKRSREERGQKGRGGKVEDGLSCWATFSPP